MQINFSTAQKYHKRLRETKKPHLDELITETKCIITEGSNEVQSSSLAAKTEG